MNGNIGRMEERAGKVNRESGFTLVELLAVVAILLILAAGGAAVFGRARGMAQSAACKGNLRLWGAAFHGYAADHGGRFPHSDNWTRGDRSGLPRSESPHDRCWVDVLPEYMGLKAWRDYGDGRKPTGNPWQCPAARTAEPKKYSYNRERDGGFSYAMNSYLSYDFDYGGYGGGEPYLNTLRCERPSRTILLFEQASAPDEGVGRHANREAGRHPGEDATALTVRHRKFAGEEGANFLFVDGHVDWRDDVWARQHSDLPKSSDDFEWFPYRYR